MTRLMVILVVALGGGCTAKPLDPYQIGTGGTGAGGVTDTGGFADTGGVTGTGGSSEVAIVGDWYAFGDGVGPNAGIVADAGGDYTDSECVKDGGFLQTACTQITSPIPGQPFAPTNAATNQYCTGGVAAQVMNKNGSPDYADLWGGGIGLNFNPAGDGGAAGYADLSAYTGIAFDFSGDLVPINAMRVDFPFLGQHGLDAPYWDGAIRQNSPLTGTTPNPQHVEIKWADIGGPYYLMEVVPSVDTTLYPFNPKAIQAIQFLVFTNTSATTPYRFCVANLAFLRN
jgi:hypothetical protein